VTLVFILFLLCTAIQLYWLSIFLTVSFEPKTGNEHAGPTVLPEGVSVIVCAHDQLHNLRNLIPVLMSQDYPAFEVIIVDDRSQDGTQDWLRHQEATISNLKVLQVSDVPQGFNPKKYALSQGIALAQYELLLLTDADCLPVSSNWIKNMKRCYQSQIEIVLGYSGYNQESGLLNKLIRYETLLTGIQYLTRALRSQPYMGVGRNLSYRKSFFQKVGGLKEVMPITGGDDDLLVNKHANSVNTTCCLSQEAVVKSIPKTSWKAYFWQKLRHLSVGKHYKNRDKWILGIFSVTHIIFWSSFVSLLITQTLVIWVSAGFLLRQLALSLIVGRWSRKLGEGTNAFYVPLLDFIYSLFYLFTGLAALTTKKITWH
jgi:glycosyltransferase involved in cell wall biosynthesis